MSSCSSSFSRINWINIINRWQTYYDSNLNYDNLIQEDIETATEEIKKIILFEGDLIVDQSTYGIGRNVNSLLEISKNAKMNIVAGAGTYCCDYINDEIKSLSIEELIQRFTNEINTGKWLKWKSPRFYRGLFLYP